MAYKTLNFVAKLFRWIYCSWIHAVIIIIYILSHSLSIQSYFNLKFSRIIIIWLFRFWEILLFSAWLNKMNLNKVQDNVHQSYFLFFACRPRNVNFNLVSKRSAKNVASYYSKIYYYFFHLFKRSVIIIVKYISSYFTHF